MFTQDVLLSRQKSWHSAEAYEIQRRPPIWVSLAILVLLAMTILVLVVVMTARAAPAPQPLDLDLPQAYLPGSPMPEDVSCNFFVPDEIFVLRCQVNFRGDQILFQFDGDMKTIIQAGVIVEDYTIGELINAWGTPTGINQTARSMYVYWGTRSAYLYSNSFRPDTQVTLVWYDLEMQRASPWRGFRHGN